MERDDLRFHDVDILNRICKSGSPFRGEVRTAWMILEVNNLKQLHCDVGRDSLLVC
jgi:hypothetical protein